MRRNFLLILFVLLLLGGCKKDKEVRVVRVQAETPDVTTTANRATISGTYNYASTLKSVVIAYGKDASLSSPQKATAEHTRDSYSVMINDLEPSTKYYYYCIFDTGYGAAESEQWSFTTQAMVTTAQMSNITPTTATCGGNVTSGGNVTVTARGVCWSTSQNPTVSNSHTTDGSGTGSFTSSITGLTANTKYYVRAYATNSAGTSYGEQKSFTTQSIDMPTVTTSPVTDITQTAATCGGNVTSDGGAAVTARGVCWSTSQNPTVNNSHTTDGSGTGSFTSSITGLTANTKYYVRAYATNSAGTSYGEQKSFTTQNGGGSIVVPTVTTSPVTDITQTTATCGGNVTGDGGAAVSVRGVCWSTSQNPTVNNNHTTDGGGTGSFTSSITGLTANTTYYVRAYATNSAGTSYGEQKSFTTLQDITLPTVTTYIIVAVTQTSATSGGNVTDDGGLAVTARGVCWSTLPNPTVNNSHTTNGAGTGSFTSSITGLTAGTRYYVRAYATNSAGTSYGEQKSFTTLQDIALPTVTTNNVTDIMQTTATCGGNVTDYGGAAVSARGVCWSTSQNPTLNNNHTTNGAGTGSFTSSITGLTAGTTYYVRAYATNSAGTSYGEQKSFTTSQSISVPTVTTSSVSNITQTTATCGGNVTSDGGAAVTARGVCWSTSQNPTVSNSHTTDGSGTGSFTSNITGLTANTTYYVRAYATNSAGTSYGEQESFCTDPYNGHAYVDLGLPSGLLWATCNVGANSPNDYGDFFGWGETEEQVRYSWRFYKWCNGSPTSLTKYNTDSNYGIVDNKTILEPADDVAHVKWGGVWRMPTKAEMEELKDNCTWEWTTQNGVNGRKVTGPNGESIFLPAAGYWDGTSLYYEHSVGRYWSSSLNTDDPRCAYHLGCGFNSVGVGDPDRYYGHSVRPVCAPQK